MPEDTGSQTRANPSRPVAIPGGGDSRRQRAMRLDVKIAQQAMKVVTPTNQQIGPWQSRAAHILAIAEKLKATGRYDPGIAEEAATLLETVETHQRDLLERVDALPADVAGSTRLDDTTRALHSVATVLRQALRLLGRGTGAA